MASSLFSSFVIVLLALLSTASAKKDLSNCSDTGPPYFLITFHDTPYNVMKFTSQGCLLGPVIVPNDHTPSGVQLRGMAIHDQGSLFVAQTYGTDDLNSSVTIYSTCQASLGTVTNRLFVSVAVQTILNPGLVHPYGVALESRSNPSTAHWLYVSSQHTDNVLRYFPTGSTGTLYQPAGFPSVVVSEINAFNMFYGTFVQYGNPGLHDSSQQGVRDVALVPSKTSNDTSSLWVANEDLTAVEIYDTQTGGVIAIFPTTGYNPVGLYYDSVSLTVFVGGSPAGGKGDGIIWGVDPYSYKIKQTFSASPMNHPAGMVALDGTLFVIEQENDHLLSFDISTTSYLGQVISSFSTYGFSAAEQIVLSPC